MTRSSGLRARVAALALAALLTSACTGGAPTPKPARIDVTPPELTQSQLAMLPRPGVYQLTSETVMVVGTFHYRDLEGGYWAVDTRQRWNAKEATSDVVIANASRLATDLQALDGQYVGVGGAMVEDGASIRMGGPEMDARWIGLVSDLAHASPTNRYGVGLYILQTGEAYANGWLVRRPDGLAVDFERPLPGAEPTRAVAIEASAGLISRAWVGGVVELYGSVEGTRAGLPLFHVLRLGSWTTTAAAFGGGVMITGAPRRWWHVEPPGLKDAPNGRKRVVGVLGRSTDGTLTVGGVPWMSSWGAPSAAVVATGALATRLDGLLGSYVGVVGRVRGRSPAGRRLSWGAAGGWIPLVSAESVTVVTTMTPTADEMVLLRGGGHY